MPMNKPHLEFHRLDMSTGWETIEGYPPTIQQKVLASDLNERHKMGSRTRLLRFEPGAYTTVPFVHDHWEEVYLLSGDLAVGSDDKGQGGESFKSPTYACRPPGRSMARSARNRVARSTRSTITMRARSRSESERFCQTMGLCDCAALIRRDIKR